ncbi:MAG: transcription elongation factor GreA [bacterium]|nr:transcription elongation factor GreA [bacterium]
MEDKTFYVTEEGLEKLKRDIEYAKTTERKDIAGRIASAKELGDLSENAEYSDAKEAQGLLESRIIDMEEQARNAKIIEKPTTSSVVVIGSTVDAENNEGVVQVFKIVGSNEANPIDGKISNQSPMGAALLGSKVGDVVEIKVPKGVTNFTVKKIS